MDLRQLEYVVAGAEEGGFTAAAAAVNVAQPALSQSVRALAGERGVELFHQVGRGGVLSSAGGAFVAAAPPGRGERGALPGARVAGGRGRRCGAVRGGGGEGGGAMRARRERGWPRRRAAGGGRAARRGRRGGGRRTGRGGGCGPPRR